ncbi:MAG: sigma-70 family RNA polymerase sigma factor [Acidimicrobiia bacterium]|nr:sigma-70 family RNA polymerase sigma factor [Acidimicrobiia bacterium]
MSSLRDRDLDTSVEGTGLDALYRAHYDGMVRLAGLLVGDFSMGEEIAQDAFARLVDARGVREPRPYLRATVINLSRSRIRRAVLARRHRAAQTVSLVDPGLGPEAVPTQIAVRDELARLPRRQREAIVLRYYADMSEAEIANALGITTGSVKTHMHRAMTTLAERMEMLR